MKTDTLSDVLRTVHLRGAVFYDLSFGQEWAAEAPSIPEIADAVFPGAGHVMEYHLISRGSGWAAILGEAPVRLQAGDIVVFPQGDAHVMSSTPGLRPIRMEPEWIHATRNDPKPIALVFSTLNAFAGGAPTAEAPNRVACGFLSCDLKPFNPLIAALPRLLHLPADDQDPWAIQAMQHAVKASQNRQPGANAVLERLSEMVFVDAVRRHAERLPEQSTGWLAGLRDRHVGRALALVHAQPEHNWTVELLASETALSRSAFCERFVRLVGQAPMHYLAQWRMQVAVHLLRQSAAPVASIALDVGYESEAAFTRAFKRQVGEPPATWRRNQSARPQNT